MSEPFTIQAGDHGQIFTTKPDPDTGAPRELLVIWRNNQVVWQGPPDPYLLSNPLLVMRELKVRIPVGLYHNFHVEKRPRKAQGS